MRSSLYAALACSGILAACGGQVEPTAAPPADTQTTDALSMEETPEFNMQRCIDLVEQRKPGMGTEVCQQIADALSSLEDMVELCSETYCVGAAYLLLTDTCQAGGAALFAQTGDPDDRRGMELVASHQVPVDEACQDLPSAGLAFVGAFDVDGESLRYGYGVGAASWRGIAARIRLPNGDIANIIIPF